jgi:hypothetical protein
MRLVDDGFPFAIEAVVDALDAGVVVRPATGNEVDRLARRRPRPDHPEVVMRRIVVEVQVGQEKMFVDVAAGQALLERVAIQERLPVGDLRIDSFRQRRQPLERRAQFQPAAQGGRFAIVQARQAEGHSPEGILALEGLVFVDPRALLFPVEREIEGLGEDGRDGQRMVLLQLERPIHHARRQIRFRRLLALVEDRRKSLAAPLRSALRVGEQARQRGFVQASAVVDQRLAGAARDPLPGRELQLARPVVAGVADDASFFEDRLDVAAIRESSRRRGGHVEARGVRRAILVVERVAGNRGAAAKDDDEQEQRFLVDDHERFPGFLRRAGACAPAACTGKASRIPTPGRAAPVPVFSTQRSGAPVWPRCSRPHRDLPHAPPAPGHRPCSANGRPVRAPAGACHEPSACRLNRGRGGHLAAWP